MAFDISISVVIVALFRRFLISFILLLKIVFGSTNDRDSSLFFILPEKSDPILDVSQTLGF